MLVCDGLGFIIRIACACNENHLGPLFVVKLGSTGLILFFSFFFCQNIGCLPTINILNKNINQFCSRKIPVQLYTA